jgi:type II restriction/modification system DNA methylase subunit YeeA
MSLDTAALKKFAQGARRQLLEQVSARMEQVLRSDSVEIREKAKVVEQLRGEIEAHGKIAVIDRVAYTWFNRFCALRFMDVNHYTRIGAVSPVEGGTQPEVLLEAKQGHVDEELARFVNPQVIFSLLNGQRPASDPQGEAYRLLLVGVCNSYSEVMPFLFEKIEDYTELLMPLDLLSENSVLHDLREALSPEACEDVEVIGWLYQYYISERKDKVFEALKQNQKIEARDIPAATQLFTPHWIVRYLVENSLGRLWMLNHPNSGLREKMEYYIAPAQEETDFLRIASPEELRLLDPACGSGHILTYAFDLLAAIYEEEGYASSDVAKLILEKNIFGVEIDPRAGALAAFALVMKARAKDRRFFTRTVSPNICVLENVTFNDAELKQYMNAVGRDLFTEPLMETLRQFEQADNFGSLIRPMLTDASYVRGMLEGKNLGGDLFLFGVHERVLKVLKQAEFLAPRYHVAVANPPYMGDRNMNAELKDFAREYYPDNKADLFAMFIERNLELAMQNGLVAMITMQSWMFLSSFEIVRKNILEKETILSMAHIGTRGFDSIGGAVVSTTAFVIKHYFVPNWEGAYLRLTTGGSEAEKNSMLLECVDITRKIKSTNLYLVSAAEFQKIPGSPIAYWVKPAIFDFFLKEKTIDDIAPPRIGMMTTDNNRFLRYWYEISINKIGFHHSTLDDAISSETKWFPYNKGGNYRKWAGNYDLVVNWYKGGQEIMNAGMTSFRGKDFYFRSGITWGDISTETFSCRYTNSGKIFDIKGTSCFPSEKDLPIILSVLNSKVGSYILNFLNPTITFQSGDIRRVPIPYNKLGNDIMTKSAERLINLSTNDWDTYETSWDFTISSLIKSEYHHKMLGTTYNNLRDFHREITLEMQRLEQENNRILIGAYDLQGEMTPDVSQEQITLTCNPYYRYGNNKSESELEELLRADTLKEFISYAVGCMFGRYSLDKPGLVLANQGETLKDYLKQVPKPTFTPDEDNVIPVLEGEWFEDDIAERFKKFLRVTFGEEHYDENLAFIEESIGRDVRSYFVKEFYKDHVQTYKKHPIYWMFSSPKGSFNALIYMHRYQPDTVSIVLNGYLREYIKKLTAHKSQLERTSVSGSASQSQKTKALKEITQVNKVLSELKEYEDDVLYPLATEQVSVDLDDGVKVNYAKFGEALSPIKGL